MDILYNVGYKTVQWMGSIAAHPWTQKIRDLFGAIHLWLHHKRLEPFERPWFQNFGIKDNQYWETPFSEYQGWVYGVNEMGQILCLRMKPCLDFLKKRQPTKTWFLSVQYLTKNCQPITIELSREIYQCENEILSVEHVARYFEHHVMPCDFEPDYLLDIVDADLNTLTLSPKQYILLCSGEYRIMESRQ